MMYNDDRERSTIEALRELSVSDPAVQIHIGSYTRALGELIRGGPAPQSGARYVAAAACFTMDQTDSDYLMATTAWLNCDQAILTFDVDEPLADPTGISVIRIEEPEVAFYDRCKLWAPVNDGRILILPEADGARHFDASGHCLSERWRRLPGTLEAGEKRAWRRLKLLASSFDRFDLERARISNLGFANDGRLTATVRKLAA